MDEMDWADWPLNAGKSHGASPNSRNNDNADGYELLMQW